MNLLLNVPWPPGVSERQACEVLDLCCNSWRAARARAQFCGPINPLRRKRGVAGQPRALSPEQRAEVQKVLTDDQHHDQPPVQVFHSLLERGVYLCSVSTMHRLMRKANLSGERRVQRPTESAAYTAFASHRAPSGLDVGHCQVTDPTAWRVPIALCGDGSV